MVGIRFLRLFARNTDNGPRLNNRAKAEAIILVNEHTIE